MKFDSYYEFRKNLVDAVARDLVGPLPSDAPDEIISDAPITRYIAGILFPQDLGMVDSSQDDGEVDEDEETGQPDPPVAMANVRYPSSMGVTFAVDARATSSILARVSVARYEPFVDSATNEERWRRVSLSCPDCEIPINDPTEDAREPLPDGLELFYRVRKKNSDGVVSVTVVLLNTKQYSGKGRRDELCFFQPHLVVESAKARLPVFVARPSRLPRQSEEDILSNRLLYRHRAQIATGHGCSVDWELDDSQPHRARRVESAIVPRCELLLADSNPQIKSEGLAMKHLAEKGRDSVLAELRKLAAGYEEWINLARRDAASLDSEFAATASRHLSGCDEALRRMRAGILELGSKADVWEAFQLANRAMLQQRSRTTWLKASKPTPAPVEGEEHQWRPFQIAFILLCLESISNPRSPDRNTADLLWFPTGGGKTEAYLGLIAFTTFLRRLRNRHESDGVTVLMRYTLRLLTIQQFERAALLMCCCENIRRGNPTLGRSPISIGLWVGRAGTPNTLKDARIALDKLRRHPDVALEESNPMQLRACAWCGAGLTPNHYYIAEPDPRLVIACRNAGCAFKEGMPVFVVDEDIYKKHPTLLIATADKFASMPWREEAGEIFNRDSGGTAPPELIIQDELHLISGPLGTLAGLYETAVDLLCEREGVRAKVIASTATIRRAQTQTKSLFDRAIAQFPPPGLRASNTYFSVETGREEKGTRLYVGFMAPAVSQATLLVRTYAALLQFAATLQGEQSIRDAYWTLLGYFNSLRVLGGARMQVQDDVSERISLLAGMSGTQPRILDNRIEMTSREPSGDIPLHLKRMANALPDRETLDVILATNMISVGVDVDRLGLMVVMGQPQSTSEYIQATSRVGRKTPGLVVTLFNGSRSRDRSHYESFVDYHSALYRQVESTSVTPFSTRARDRGLHAVVIALARLMLPEFKSNHSAAQIGRHINKLEAVKLAVLKRVSVVAPPEVDAVASQIDEIIQQWVQRAAQQKDLVFVDFQHPDRALLVNMAGADEYADGSFPTLWSLRDVDMSSNLYQVG